MSFLKNALASVTIAPKAVNRTSTGGSKKERNPVTADIRIFKNGAVYPSAALVTRFGMEFQDRDSVTPGFGFDVIDGRVWPNATVSAIFVSPIRRDSPKVDLFGSTTWDANGKPMSSVLDQGATTFGKKMLAMIAEVYNITIAEDADQDYIDLVLEEDNAFQAQLDAQLQGVFHFPKTIAAGERKGQMSYQRRENAKVFGLVPVELMEGNNEVEL